MATSYSVEQEIIDTLLAHEEEITDVVVRIDDVVENGIKKYEEAVETLNLSGKDDSENVDAETLEKLKETEKQIHKDVQHQLQVILEEVQEKFSSADE